MDYVYRVFPLCRCFLDDVAVMSFLRRRCWCCLPSPFRPAAFLSSRWWSAVFVRQSSFVLMNIYYADVGSLVSSPWSPAELDKQFASNRWTLEDDDDPTSSLPDLTWLCTFILLCLLCILHYCIRTSCPSVSLSVIITSATRSSYPQCGHIIRMFVFHSHVLLYLLSIYSVFTLHLSCIYPLISVPLCTSRCYKSRLLTLILLIRLLWADLARYSVR